MNKENKNLTKGKKFLIIAIICIVIITAVLIVLKVRKSNKEGNEIGVNSDTAEVKMINGNIYAPKDATVVNDKLDEGVVIKDKNQNEWVWIEVPKDASLVYQTAGLDITEFNNENCQKIRYDLKNYVKGIKSEEQANLGEDYWIQMADDGAYSKYDPLVSETYDKNLDWLKRTQGCGISYWEYSDLYTHMLKSIYENGGFYIGRYETGYTDEKNSTEINQNPKIKQNITPYNNVTISDAIKLSQKLSTNGLTTSVIFNIQWDLALKFISSKQDSAKNIYDLAGKTSEFTLGFTSDNAPCTKRGVKNDSKENADFASYIEGCTNTDLGGFRCVLFK